MLAAVGLQDFYHLAPIIPLRDNRRPTPGRYVRISYAIFKKTRAPNTNAAIIAKTFIFHTPRILLPHLGY